MMLSLRKNEEIVGGIYSYLAINCMVDIDPPNYMTNIPATDEPISHTKTDTEELDFWHWISQKQSWIFQKHCSVAEVFWSLILWQHIQQRSKMRFSQDETAPNCEKSRSYLPMLLWKWLDVEMQRHVEPQGSAELQEIFQLKVITSSTTE